MFKNTIIIFILIQSLFSQFSDVQISYEYNDRMIGDDKTYILEEFNSLIENYFNMFIWGSKSLKDSLGMVK